MKTRPRCLLLAAAGCSALWLQTRLLHDPLQRPGGDTAEHAKGIRRSQKIEPMVLPLPLTNRLGWAELRRLFGGLIVPVQTSSLTEDDVSTLHEEPQELRTFIDNVVAGQVPRHSYCKLLDDDPAQEPMDEVGRAVTQELTHALRQRGVSYAPFLHWSLWLGANSSSTSMHWDYQSFSLIHVVEGAKRFVLIDPAFHFDCTEQPRHEPHSCWTHLDVLSSPPSYARELLLLPGQTLIIPFGHWHAVENIGPTVAFGLNTWTPF